MQITERKIYRNLPFEDYLQLPGFSHSDIKNNGKKVFATPKMQLGTLVHNYLNEPELYSGEHREIVKPAAFALKQAVGELWRHMESEVSVTCNFQNGGFTMPYRGRGDKAIIGKLVIDFKVSEMPLSRSVPYFGYNEQVGGYGISFDAQSAIIIKVNPKVAVRWYNTGGIGESPVSFYHCDLLKAKKWWAQQIQINGTPL